jgi:Zn finger protein HypA/HybF involved in hydrogenase expression
MADEKESTQEEAYCVKCRAKRNMLEGKEVSMKGKGNVERRAMSGTCETCGTKMFKILPKKQPTE